MSVKSVTESREFAGITMEAYQESDVQANLIDAMGTARFRGPAGYSTTCRNSIHSTCGISARLQVLNVDALISGTIELNLPDQASGGRIYISDDVGSEMIGEWTASTNGPVPVDYVLEKNRIYTVSASVA